MGNAYVESEISFLKSVLQATVEDCIIAENQNESLKTE